MVLLIDNYDSFTYNLYHLIGDLDLPCEVVRNDKIKLSQIIQRKPKAIVLSPGPGHPSTSGICLDILKNLSPKIPTLGVCLGHQAIGYIYNSKVIHAPLQMHGKKSIITHKNKGMFKGLPQKIEVMRYHSLLVDRQSLSKSLEITAETKDGLIMGLRHKKYPIEGLQFHPESFASQYGHELLQNFFKEYGS